MYGNFTEMCRLYYLPRYKRFTLYIIINLSIHVANILTVERDLRITNEEDREVENVFLTDPNRVDIDEVDPETGKPTEENEDHTAEREDLGAERGDGIVINIIYILILIQHLYYTYSRKHGIIV